MSEIDLTQLTPEQKAALLADLQADHVAKSNAKKEAYEGLRKDFLSRVKTKIYDYTEAGKNLKEDLRAEAGAFMDLMKEYGEVRSDEQLSFQLSDDEFKFISKGNKVKKFDERADLAEKRLVDFLQQWVADSEKGEKDPMYKLAMAMIQRNDAGDLDYKSISRLYELESDFNSPEYSAIMQLFKESNIVEKTVIHFYFEEKDQYNKWRRLEPSFNRM